MTSKSLNKENDGFGNIQRNLGQRPFSILAGSSISAFATLVWIKPPNVRAVLSIIKFAFPETEPIIIMRVVKLPVARFHDFPLYNDRNVEKS